MGGQLRHVQFLGAVVEERLERIAVVGEDVFTLLGRGVQNLQAPSVQRHAAFLVRLSAVLQAVGQREIRVDEHTAVFDVIPPHRPHLAGPHRGLQHELGVERPLLFQLSRLKRGQQQSHLVAWNHNDFFVRLGRLGHPKRADRIARQVGDVLTRRPAVQRFDVHGHTTAGLHRLLGQHPRHNLAPLVQIRDGTPLNPLADLPVIGGHGGRVDGGAALQTELGPCFLKSSSHDRLRR